MAGGREEDVLDPGCADAAGARLLLRRLRSGHAREVARTAAGVRAVRAAGKAAGAAGAEAKMSRLREKERERLSALAGREEALLKAVAELYVVAVGDEEENGKKKTGPNCKCINKKDNCL